MIDVEGHAGTTSLLRQMTWRWRRHKTTAALLGRRRHGALDVIGHTERRPLRPIGATALEVAVRTDLLLAALLSMPGVRLFHGVRSAFAGVPALGHAVCAGRTVILIDSVAWPPGRYHTSADGRVHCDGTYIGQSAGPLHAAVRHWRAVLSGRHRVSAMVVVHPAGDGDLRLPAPTAEVAWALAADAADDLRRRVDDRRAASRRALAALLAATVDTTRA